MWHAFFVPSGIGMGAGMRFLDYAPHRNRGRDWILNYLLLDNLVLLLMARL